ncbi:MAG: hypothetical protein ACRDMI_11255 [Streptosporangiaceae bacterium]
MQGIVSGILLVAAFAAVVAAAALLSVRLLRSAREAGPGEKPHA